MAVYNRNYKTYSGPLTGIRRRWLVITRFSLDEVFASRVSTVLFVMCLVPALLSAVVIYVVNSDTARLLLNMRPDALFAIDNKFFFKMLEIQGWLALFLTAWVGPVMVSPDLTNNALPLFLSRPVSRAEYVLGKVLVLVVILSAVTWVPLLLLFVIQAQVSRTPWLAANLYIAPGMVVGALLWIAVLALIALAVSAFVRWRIVATGLMVAVVLIPAGFAAVVSAVLQTRWGLLFNAPYVMTVIWMDLLRVPFRFEALPVAAAWMTPLVVCVACVFLLNFRIQARQVVRG
jgi:ABC-type transport system involved in multi-copper enzyme maturation permease subunit